MNKLIIILFVLSFSIPCIAWEPVDGRLNPERIKQKVGEYRQRFLDEMGSEDRFMNSDEEEEAEQYFDEDDDEDDDEEYDEEQDKSIQEGRE